jgi:protein-disulfide isomerase
MIKKIMIFLFLGLFIFSCSDFQDAAKSIKEVNENQDLIINKLNAIDKKIATLETKIAQQPTPQGDKKKDNKPKTDPNKVYNIADAGSVVLGNPSASVTVIEWTDFQ